MMRVEIPDRDARRAIFNRVKCSNGNIAKVTKPHRLIGRSVMPRRSHQTKRPLASHRRARNIHSRAYRTQRVLVKLRVNWRISIEISGRRFDALDMVMRMRWEQRRVVSRLRHSPFPIWVSGLQQRNRSRYSLRMFGVADFRVFSTMWVVKNDHSLKFQEPGCKLQSNSKSQTSNVRILAEGKRSEVERCRDVKDAPSRDFSISLEMISWLQRVLEFGILIRSIQQC